MKGKLCEAARVGSLRQAAQQRIVDDLARSKPFFHAVASGGQAFSWRM